MILEEGAPLAPAEIEPVDGTPANRDAERGTGAPAMGIGEAIRRHLESTALAANPRPVAPQADAEPIRSSVS